jgi:hypothetical protein
MSEFAAAMVWVAAIWRCDKRGMTKMTKPRSIDEVLAKLQEQVDFHAERESFHAAQEELHREQRSSHAGALEEARRRLEVFRAAAADALELAERSVLPTKRQQSELALEDVDLGSLSRPKLGRMVTLILDSKEPEERFGAIELSREVNERFRDRMRRAVDPAQMSVVLRRLHRRGRIHLVRAGRPYKEALYVRERPPTEDRS